MNAANESSVEQRLACLAAEVELVRSELRTLQEKPDPSSSRRSGSFAGFVLVGMIAVGALAHRSIAQQENNPWWNSVPVPTILDAPVEIRGKSGKPLVRISQDKGHSGLEVFGPEGQRTALGWDAEAGGVWLYRGPDVRASLRSEGFSVFDSTGVVAYLGKEQGPGSGGLVSVYNAASKAVGFLVAKENGGGNVTVAEPNGDGVFSAGYTGDGGNACVASKKLGVKCVGIGLPMTIQVPAK